MAKIENFQLLQHLQEFCGGKLKKYPRKNRWKQLQCVTSQSNLKTEIHHLNCLKKFVNEHIVSVAKK